jgi:citrate synthase
MYFAIRKMKIGRQTHNASAICGSNPETIIVRGKDLCGELIGHIGFTEHVWLLVTGALPSEAQRRMLDATLVAIAEHGLVPSVQVSRMTLAASPEALQGAVAAGLLGCGSVILGSAAAAGEFLESVVSSAGASGFDAAARARIQELRAAKKPVPGFGHPLHRGYDPRAKRLSDVAREVGVAGRYLEAVAAVEKALPELTGKTLALNVSGAIAATMLDAGYPLLALKGVPLLARTASLIAHLLEEQQRPVGFVLSYAGSEAVEYDGPAPTGFVASNT